MEITMRQVLGSLGSSLLLAATLVAPGAVHAGTVDVSFVEPDKFVDAGRGSFDIGQTTQVLGDHLKTFANQLPQSQTLKIEVTDVDLAGELRPTRMASEVRVLRGRADWPRISLRYTLSENGRVLRNGESQINDMAYMTQPLRSHVNDALAYERRMLDQWFRDTIAGTPVATR